MFQPIDSNRMVNALELRKRRAASSQEVKQAVEEHFGPLLTMGPKRAGNIVGVMYLSSIGSSARHLLLYQVDHGSSPELQAALASLRKAVLVRDLGSLQVEA